MTRHHDIGDEPIEDDPTGMRALLSALPDPGPMPEDLVARITAALRQEQATRSADDVHVPLAGPDAAGAGIVPTLAGHRRRHGRLQWLGAAAAVIAVGGVGGGAVLHSQGSSLSALLSGGASSSSSLASATGSERHVADGRAGAVSIRFTDTAYDAAALAAQAGSLAGGPLTPMQPLQPESPAIGPIGTAMGARTCATALGIAPSAHLYVDVGTFEGRPAAVLLADTGGGRTAYAVQRSCTTGHPGLLKGPVTVP